MSLRWSSLVGWFNFSINMSYRYVAPLRVWIFLSICLINMSLRWSSFGGSGYFLSLYLFNKYVAVRERILLFYLIFQPYFQNNFKTLSFTLPASPSF